MARLGHVTAMQLQDLPDRLPARSSRRAADDRDAVLRAILARRSVSPKRLLAPGPSRAEIELMVAAAATAPDHCGLRPWRFIRIADAARGALADLFVAAKRRRAPKAHPSELSRERERAQRAPTVLAVVARLTGAHSRVSLAEQYVSTGAAVQNILLSAAALGFGAMMVSGSKTRDANLRRALGLEAHEELIGFICIGSAAGRAKARVRPEVSEILSEWTG